MFSGVQFSIYPMTDDFVGTISHGLSALDPYRERLRIETDDVSTLVVGPADQLFAAMRDLFVAVAGSGVHCVLSATVSRGCPGEPDDPICHGGIATGARQPLAERSAQARNAVAEAPVVGLPVSGQVSLYVMGTGNHMDEIGGCIDFLKASGVYDRSKHFCTKVGGDAGAVFEALSQSFLRFGPPEGHVTLDVTISANSPSLR